MEYIKMPLLLSVLLLWLTGCGQPQNNYSIDINTVQDSTDIIYSVTGLDGPEAVRYDPDQQTYFISNFTGGGNTRDSTGFITKTDDKGNIIDLKFMTGSGKAPLHAPRGMFITGETLWAADVLGVHGFNKTTGKHTHFIDFSQFDIGFLNDITADSEGTLYVTDTGTARVFRIKNEEVSIFIDDLPSAPNGITRDPNSGKFLLAPWGGDQIFYTFDDIGELEEFATLIGGNFDGIEFIGPNLLSASQRDSSIRIYKPMHEKLLIHTPGRPADIGINTDLLHIAVPYIALDRVDIWSLR